MVLKQRTGTKCVCGLAELKIPISSPFIFSRFLGSAQTWLRTHSRLLCRTKYMPLCTEMSYSWILLKVSKRRCELQRSWQSGERAAVCGHAIAQHKTNEFVHDLKLLISRSNWSVRVECGCLPSSRFIVLRFTIYCFFFPFLFMVQSWAEQHLICIEWWTGNANASKLSKPLYKHHRGTHRDVVRRHWLAGLVALRSPL